MKGKDYLERLKREKAAKDVRLPVPSSERVSEPAPSAAVFPDGKPADLPAKTQSVGHRGLRLVWAHGREV